MALALTVLVGFVFDAITIITTAIATIGDTLAGVAGPAAGLGAGVLALFFGWRLVQRFIS